MPPPLKARIGLGCVTFGREIDEASSFVLLDHALERGVSHFDTAAAYGAGASEAILGKWLASRKPEGLTIATKILPPYDSVCIEGSQRRLGVEQIDLLYLHQWHDSAIQAGPALDALVRSGQVKQLGISNVTVDQLQATGARFGFVQNLHNLAVSNVSEELRAHCLANEIRIVTYSPLGAGFLTGKHQHGVEAGSRFDIIPGHQQVYFHDAAYALLARLEAVSKSTGHSQAHLALAWALHQPGIDTMLVGGRTPAHLDQAFATLAFDDASIWTQLNA